MSIDKDLGVFIDIQQEHGVPDLQSLCQQDISDLEGDVASSLLNHHQQHQHQQHQQQQQQQQQHQQHQQQLQQQQLQQQQLQEQQQNEQRLRYLLEQQQLQQHLLLQQQQQQHHQYDLHQLHLQRHQYSEVNGTSSMSSSIPLGKRVTEIASVPMTTAAAAAAAAAIQNDGRWTAAGAAGQEQNWALGQPPPKKRSVGTRTCQHAGAGGCSRRPSFNHPGRKAIFCSAHRQLNMVDVAHKARCQHPQGCTKHPGYGFPGKKPTHCAGHRLDGQIDRKRRKTNPSSPARAAVADPPSPSGEKLTGDSSADGAAGAMAAAAAVAEEVAAASAAAGRKRGASKIGASRR